MQAYPEKSPDTHEYKDLENQDVQISLHKVARVDKFEF
jgi:hypothetical protein